MQKRKTIKYGIAADVDADAAGLNDNTSVESLEWHNMGNVGDVLPECQANTYCWWAKFMP